MQQPRSRDSLNPHLWVAAFTLVIAAVAAPAPRATIACCGFGTAQAVQMPGPPLEQYRAFRRMTAHSEKMNHQGSLEAWTEFDASGFRYQIVAERGSGTVRNRVLKAILKREQELIANGDFGRGEVTPDNYRFGQEEASGDLRYVPITPRRKDVMLIDGRMVLDSAGELLRVEGRLSKNPSFWTTQVNVVRHYARLDGVRVPVGTESIAKVRFAGLSRLNVSYEYETINHRMVRTTPQPVPTAISSASGR